MRLSGRSRSGQVGVGEDVDQAGRVFAASSIGHKGGLELLRAYQGIEGASVLTSAKIAWCCEYSGGGGVVVVVPTVKEGRTKNSEYNRLNLA